MRMENIAQPPYVQDFGLNAPRRQHFGVRASADHNNALTATGEHGVLSRVAVRGRQMRVFSVGGKCLVVALAVTAVCGLGLYRASADEIVPAVTATNVAAADASPSTPTIPSAKVLPAAVVPNDAIPQVGAAADNVTPCQFVPHAQAALVLAASQKNDKVDEYGKLMSVPQDGTSGEFSDNNQRVRDILVARPQEDLVICVAGCPFTERVVFAQPAAIQAFKALGQSANSLASVAQAKAAANAAQPD